MKRLMLVIHSDMTMRVSGPNTPPLNDSIVDGPQTPPPEDEDENGEGEAKKADDEEEDEEIDVEAVDDRFVVQYVP